MLGPLPYIARGEIRNEVVLIGTLRLHGNKPWEVAVIHGGPALPVVQGTSKRVGRKIWGFRTISRERLD